MSKSQSPIICVTCQRPLPKDLQEDDRPRYFAQEMIFPRSDDNGAFSNEAATIVRFVEAVSYVTRYATEVPQKHSETILELLLQLAEEAQRRLDLADSAAREIWARDHGEDSKQRRRD